MKERAYQAWFYMSTILCFEALKGVVDACLNKPCLSSFSSASQEGQTQEEARACPACAKRGQQGRLGLKLARSSGGFIGCSLYPDCSYSQPLEDINESIKSDEETDEMFPGLSEGATVHLCVNNSKG